MAQVLQHFTLNRQLQLKKIVILEIFSQISGVIFMVAWAWYYPSVWALVFGGLFASLLKFTLSFSYLPSIRHYFQWDPSMANEIFHFGKWIFLSTIFTFIASQGDRLILGKLISIQDLGVYSISIILATFLPLAVQNLSNRIQFPLLSRLASEGIENVKKQLFKIRSWILIPSLFLICIFVAFGDKIIGLLYDQRYHEAKWMFQILSFGSIASLFEITLIPIFLATGNSYRHMLMMFFKAILLLSCLTIGCMYAGVYGAILGITLSCYLSYGVACYYVKEYGIKPLALDSCFFASALGFIWLLWTVSSRFL